MDSSRGNDGLTGELEQVNYQEKGRDRMEPGEWKYDDKGQKYRDFGNGCREYAMTMNVHGVEVPVDELEDFYANHKIEKKRTSTDKPKKTQYCPFNFSARMIRECRPGCAFYDNGGCRMRRRKADRDTLNKDCPYMSKCSSVCAVYENGCTL